MITPTSAIRFHLAALLFYCPLSVFSQENAYWPPLTDNQSAPYMGVYTGCIIEGIEGNGRYAAWLGRTNVWGHDTLPFGQGSTWHHVSGKWQDWFYDPWSKWIQAAPNRRLVLSVPILPGPADGSGTTDGDGSGKPVSLAEGATGAYNAYYRGLAETLVARGLGNSILRLGWEWNGNWYAWKVTRPEEARHFAAYWRQIVDTIRSVPGTENLQFNWNVSSGFKTSYDPAEAYPGDAYVDQIGIDVYDKSWDSSGEFPSGFYPVPPNATEAEAGARHHAAWEQSIIGESAWGIGYWQTFADNHNKPLTIPEWGLIQSNDPNSRGGGDNTYFIQQMYEYIQNPKHRVYFASYFDYDGDAAGNSRISPTNVHPNQFPEASTLYKKLFALPTSK